MRPFSGADRAFLAALLAVAAALRLSHLDYGLPAVVYVDSFMYVGEAGRMLEPGPYAPQTFWHPSLYMDALAGLYWLLGLETTYARHLAARLLATACSLLLIVLLYLAVRRQASTRAATFAAAAAAVCPVLVTSARVENTDSALVLFTTAALLCLGRLPGSLRAWSAVGILAGLAVATKYTGLFLLPFAALAAGIAAWRTGRWGAQAAGAAAAVGIAALVFVLATPWMLPLFGAYRDAFETQLLVQRLGQVGRVQASAWDYFVSATPTWEQPWLGTSLLSNLGLPLFVAALAAWAWAILGGGGFRRRFEALFVLAFLVATCGAGRLKAIRYLLPILPLLYVLVGCAADRVLRALPRWATPALLVLLLARPAIDSAHAVAMAAAPMTNHLAHAWLQTNVARGSRVFVSPLFVDDLADLPFDFQGLGPAGFNQYRLPEGKGPSAERTPIYYPALVDELRRDGVAYLVLNSWFEDAFSPVPENLRFFPRSVAAYREFRARLEASATLVWRVEGIAERRLGPAISVYRLRAAS